MKIGYICTSKKDQNPELQRRDLLAFGCEKIFEEQISSRRADRPELRAAMEFCREGGVTHPMLDERAGKLVRLGVEAGYSNASETDRASSRHGG